MWVYIEFSKNTFSLRLFADIFPPALYTKYQNRQCFVLNLLFLFSHVNKTLEMKLVYSFCFSIPFQPWASAIISAARSPMAKTVSMGLIVGISGKTPASAILMPLSPRTLSV